MARFRRIAMIRAAPDAGLGGVFAVDNVADVAQAYYLSVVADPSGDLTGSGPSWRSGW